MYREILTKAIIAKGEKIIEEEQSKDVEKNVSKALGCWIINHKYNIIRKNQSVYLQGSYDVYLWYGYNDDTACDLAYITYNFSDNIPYTFSDENEVLNDNSEIKCNVLKQPTCNSMTFENSTIKITILRSYCIDIVGETKLTIKVNDVTIDKMIDTNYIKDTKKKDNT